MEIRIMEDEDRELQAAFDKDDNLLHFWYLNDANWRHEYLDPLMNAVGIKIKQVGKNAKRNKAIREATDF